MHGAPGELQLGYLFPPLFEGAELLVVSIEELEERLKARLNVLINPGSILEFDNDVECVDH
jgi:hypothetical protein